MRNISASCGECPMYVNKQYALYVIVPGIDVACHYFLPARMRPKRPGPPETNLPRFLRVL